MDKYKRLLSNTVVFAIGTFSSKLLVFALIPFYSNILTQDQLGIADLTVQIANLLLPLVSMGIANAVIRFGLDQDYEKSSVFSGGLYAILAGYLIFLLISPLLRMALSSPELMKVQNYFWLVYLFVISSCLRSLCSCFVRSMHLVRLYAFDGLLTTILVIIFNLLFLGVFKLGITGYILATILSDVCSALFLFIAAQLYRYLSFVKMEWPVLASMLRYAIPLIPTTVFWWITNVSDHFLVTDMIGADANGVYVISYKLPTIITLISSIFLDAWQLSAVTENAEDRSRFFTNVFRSFSALLFTAASGLIFLARPMIYLLVLGKEGYFAAWRYVPFLLIATVFSCLSNFLGSVYMLERKSTRTFVTAAICAGTNIVFNLILIPRFGVMGAAFATFFSYLCMFFARLLDTRKYIVIHWRPLRLFGYLAILLAQTTALLYIEDRTSRVLVGVFLCLLMVVLNFKQLLINVQRLFLKKNKKTDP